MMRVIETGKLINPIENFNSVTANYSSMHMPRRKRAKTICPEDNGKKQHLITEFGRKEPIKIVLKEIKPKS
jgi:hypothetical protein